MTRLRLFYCSSVSLAELASPTLYSVRCLVIAMSMRSLSMTWLLVALSRAVWWLCSIAAIFPPDDQLVTKRGDVIFLLRVTLMSHSVPRLRWS